MITSVPVAQRIEQDSSKVLMGVRFPPGTPQKHSFFIGVFLFCSVFRESLHPQGAFAKRSKSL